MNREGFIQRLMAALGVGGSLGLHSRQSDVPDLPAPAPPCSVCGGAGEVLDLRRSDFIRRTMTPCPECQSPYGRSLLDGMDKLQRDINREDTRQLELEGELWRMQSPF